MELWKKSCWRGFKDGKWQSEINVRDFIKSHYTEYSGDSLFLEGKTDRTSKVLNRVQYLLQMEIANGGVLDVDTNTVSSLLNYKPGYVLKEEDIIVGLQTDAPLKRAVIPFAGFRNAVQACEANGYELGQHIKDAFEYRTTHNTGVFRVYSDTMKRARHA